MTLYDELAGEYDELMGQAQRTAAAEQFVAKLLGMRDVSSAIDVACGTGLYAMALADAGVATVGADISANMLAQAKLKAAGRHIQWIEAAMQDLAPRVDKQHDAVICMGNSLPHLLADEDFDAALAGFRKMLAPGGTLVLHVLNYDAILEQQDRLVGANRSGELEFVRFYDFLPDGLLQFNVLRLQWSGADCSQSLQSTILRPYRHDELRTALTRHGYADVAAFGNLRMGPFDQATSGSLVMVARA